MPAVILPIKAAAERHQDLLLGRAERTANEADRVIRRVWQTILGIVRAGRPWHQTYFALRQALLPLRTVPRVLTADLVRAGQDAHRFVGRTIAEKIPVRMRARVIARRRLVESDPIEDLIALMLPAPSEADVLSVVYQAGWATRFDQFTSLIQPDALAATMASAVTQGRTGAEIIALVRPQVENLRVVARRVARDASLHVAHSMEMKAYESLGADVVTGYTVHSVGDTHVRPEHRKRNGTTYYREPKRRQKGFDEMPRPPFESPRDGGKIAFGCRCWLSPVIAVD